MSHIPSRFLGVSRLCFCVAAFFFPTLSSHALSCGFPTEAETLAQKQQYHTAHPDHFILQGQITVLDSFESTPDIMSGQSRGYTVIEVSTVETSAQQYLLLTGRTSHCASFSHLTQLDSFVSYLAYKQPPLTTDFLDNRIRRSQDALKDFQPQKEVVYVFDEQPIIVNEVERIQSYQQQINHLQEEQRFLTTYADLPVIKVFGPPNWFEDYPTNIVQHLRTALIAAFSLFLVLIAGTIIFFVRWRRKVPPQHSVE